MEDFIASDKYPIKLHDGWFEKKNTWPQGVPDFHTFAAGIADQSPEHYQEGTLFLINKLATASCFKQILRQHGHSRFDGPMLDLCTGPGVLPRILKATGVCPEADGIDIFDRVVKFPDEFVIETLAKMRQWPEQEEGGRIFELLWETMEFQTGVQDTFNVFWVPFDRSKIRLDNLILDDALEHEYDRRYDLVTWLTVAESTEKRSRTVARSRSQTVPRAIMWFDLKRGTNSMDLSS